MRASKFRPSLSNIVPVVVLGVFLWMYLAFSGSSLCAIVACGPSPPGGDVCPEIFPELYPTGCCSTCTTQGFGPFMEQLLTLLLPLIAVYIIASLFKKK